MNRVYQYVQIHLHHFHETQLHHPTLKQNESRAEHVISSTPCVSKIGICKTSWLAYVHTNKFLTCSVGNCG